MQFSGSIIDITFDYKFQIKLLSSIDVYIDTPMFFTV